MKKYMKAGIIAVILIAVCTGIYFYSSKPETVIFSGINGEEISVRTNIKSQVDDTEVGSGNVQPGDIIEINDSKEVVIGISEDGRYITISYEDYVNESK